MITVTVTVTGVKETQAGLEKLKDAISHLQPVLQDVGDYMMNFLTNDVFESEGGVYGSSWAELSPSTLIQKLKKYPGRGILEASGKMRYGYNLEVSDQAAIISNNAQSESGAYYAMYHQTGTDKMPKRTLIKIDEDRKRMIQEKFSDYLNKSISDSF